MAITKFMQVMFSAVEREDEELANQVAGDIEAAKKDGSVETEEIDYRHMGNGDVMIHDKVNNELTLAQQSEEDHESYDLIAMPDNALETYLHPLEDGVSHEEITSGESEDFHEHVGPEYYLQGENNVQETADMHEALEGGPVEEEKEFSVYTENVAVQRIFSDQEFCERLFSEAIESEEVVKVGDIKVEKIDDDTVLVTSESTGDQARVELDGDEMEVTELEQKEMSEEELEDSDEQYEPMFVVGVDVDNHVIVDAPVYTPEDAQDLAMKLSDNGVEGIGVFECPMEAREHAEMLLQELGIQNEENVAEPEQAEFSDYGVYVTRFFTDNEIEEIERYFSEAEEEYYERLFSEVDLEDCSDFMLKMFSETEDNAPAQEMIEDALESGEEIETDEEIVTPISEDTVVVEDKENGEFTKITVSEDDMDVNKISAEEAKELTEDVGREEGKNFSITSYMVRLFSESEEDEMPMMSDVKKALETGESVETSDEIITPVSSDEVVVEDKETGEFTKVGFEDGELDAEEISESEAMELLKEEEEVAEEESPIEEEEPKEEEKSYSEINPILSKFFSVAAPQAVAPAVAPVAAPAAVAPVQEMPMVDPNAVAAPVEPEIPVEIPSVEAIEDKALAAVEAIHAAAQDAANMIQQAKEAPVPGAEEDLQEAQFSDKLFSETLSTWLNRNINK